MPRLLPLALAAGLGSAVLYAAALSGSLFGIMLAYLAMLPLFAVGLALGWVPAAIAGGAAVAGIAVFGDPLAGALFAISHAIPCIVLITLALRSRTWSDGQVYWYPASRLLAMTALWCAGLTVIAGLTLVATSGGFEASIAGFLSGMAQSFQGGDGVALNTQALGGIATIVPGIVAWSWMIMASLNGLVAQSMLRRAGRNIRPSPTLADIEVGPRWIAIFGATALAGFLLPGDLGFGATNLAIVLAYPLFFQGLSVVHTALGHWGAGVFGLAVFYGLLIILGWTALAVIALGLLEPIVRIRARLAGPQNT